MSSSSLFIDMILSTIGIAILWMFIRMLCISPYVEGTLGWLIITARFVRMFVGVGQMITAAIFIWLTTFLPALKKYPTQGFFDAIYQFGMQNHSINMLSLLLSMFVLIAGAEMIVDSLLSQPN